jgi:hypothetical protein
MFKAAFVCYSSPTIRDWALQQFREGTSPISSDAIWGIRLGVPW